MKINEIITETPQIIGQLNPVEIETIRKECVQTLINKTAKVVIDYNGLTKLYRYIRSNAGGVYFLATRTTIDYVVNYRLVELSDKVLPMKHGVRQVLIHRFPNSSTFAAGVGSLIFWHYLFGEYKCLLSDSQQTADGKAIWQYKIKEATDQGRTVRLINTNDNTFEDIKSLVQLASLDEKIWGSAKWFQRIVIAIF